MSARGKRAFVKPCEDQILEMVIDNPGLTLEELADKIIRTIKWPGKAPEIEGMIKRVRAERKKIKDTPQDRPWSTASLKDYPIPPEALPIVLELWKYRLNRTQSFTIREAKWASRLSATKVQKYYHHHGGKKRRFSRIEWLDFFAGLYAKSERINDIQEQSFDSEGLDRNLAGLLPVSVGFKLNMEKYNKGLRGDEALITTWEKG